MLKDSFHKIMKKSTALAVLFVVIGITISLSVTVSAQQSFSIPVWIKNNAKWWSEGQIEDSDFVKGIQYLIDNNILHVGTSKDDQDIRNYAVTLQKENDKLQSDNQNLQNQLQQDDEQLQQLQSQSAQSQQYSNTLEEQLKQAQAKINTQQSQAMTVISSGTVNWYFSDSKGYRYHWSIPVHTYDLSVIFNVLASGAIPTYNLKLSDGGTVSTYDYRELAKLLSEKREFSSVVDTLYDNAGSDDQFIYEVWHMVAELTTYSKDITSTNLLPYEVLTRGEGDCKDKAILIADLLRSSSHTSNWDIHLVIMDDKNPTNPQTVNHMIVSVDTGQQQYLIEPTTTPDVNGLNFWKGTITGWNVPF